MTLGEKLKLARLEAGLSQRALCGDMITRNMLSQIEHGTAKPSMDTLRYLAKRLEKPMSFFLEEEHTASPNLAAVTKARDSWKRGDWEQTLEDLQAFREPDILLTGEYHSLRALALLAGAEQAAKSGRKRYALELLGYLDCDRIPYFSDVVFWRRRLLLAELGEPEEGDICMDRPLLAGAQICLARQDADRAEKRLEAMEDRQSPLWNRLRGEVSVMQGAYAQAIPFLLLAETAFPEQTIPLLERCYRELGDYRNAYLYACKQKGKR